MSYKFNLNTMRTPKAELDFEIEDGFFEKKDYSPIRKGDVRASLQIERTPESYVVSIRLEGFVVTSCMRCMGELRTPICSDNEVKVKMTDTVREDDEYVYVNRKEGILDLEPLIYDFIVLSVPERHVHEDGECDKDMEEALKQYLVN